MSFVESGRKLFALLLEGGFIPTNARELSPNRCILKELVSIATIHGFDPAEKKRRMLPSIECGQELKVLFARP